MRIRLHQGVKTLLLITLLTITLTNAVLAKNAIDQNNNKPNLLFIMTDQQRFDAMSCAGNTVLKTPNLDRIAREGVIFTSNYSANPVCVPSRAILLSGLSSENVKVWGNGDVDSEVVPEVPTFDRILKENGYAAEYYGKWHTPYQFTDCYDNAVNPVSNKEQAIHIIKAYNAWLNSKGVTKTLPGEGQLYSSRNLTPYTPVALDYNYENRNLSTDEKMALKASQETQYGCVNLPPNISYAAYNTEQTLEALERMKDGPFTLTCSFDPPHPPMVIQEPYYSMYPPDAIPIPESINDPMTNSPYEAKGNSTSELPYKDAENIRHMRSIYYAMVREIDDKVGEMLDKLDELGLAENTLVVFTSDHGEMLGDHGMHSKSIFYEGGAHVPLLMRFPGRIEAGTVVEEPVSTMDISSTILDYLEMPIPTSDGISLRPFIDGNPVEHDVVSYSPGNNKPNYMLRYGDLKLVMAETENAKGVNGLYDLKADPLEMRNLITSPISFEENRQQAEMMKARLVKWLEEHESKKADGVKNRPLNMQVSNRTFQAVNPHVQIYPNPSGKENITLETRELAGDIQYIISDQKGVVISKGKATGSKTVISTQKLNTGMYIVTVIGENKTAHSKLMIQ